MIVNEHTTVGEAGERSVIRHLAESLKSREDVLCGIGDDCAVLRVGNQDLVMTTDPLIESVHFLPESDPGKVGGKAIARVLSDIAAMGATPAWLLINLTLPDSFPLKRLQLIYEGAEEMAAKFDAVIVGGDTAAADRFSMHVFGVGTMLPGQARLRSHAGSGDVVLVTGTLGGSILGRHLDFIPRVHEGRWLAEQDAVHAMIDVSDGLISELVHVATASHKKLVVDALQLPVSEAAVQCAEESGQSPVWHALHDGEDFELIITVEEHQAAELETRWRKKFNCPLTKIGYVKDEMPIGVSLCYANAENEFYDVDNQGGFEHLVTGKKNRGQVGSRSTILRSV